MQNFMQIDLVFAQCGIHFRDVDYHYHDAKRSVLFKLCSKNLHGKPSSLV
jgi:hypothetical protein